MAAGGVACTGCTGEDYSIPGYNALVLESGDPWEFVSLFGELHANPVQERALRRAGQVTARHYAWPHIVQGILLPRLHQMVEPRRSLHHTPQQQQTMEQHTCA